MSNINYHNQITWLQGIHCTNTHNNMDGKNSEYHTKPKLLEQAKRAMRTRNYSPRTITAYVQWIKRFILFHNKQIKVSGRLDLNLHVQRDIGS